jgi:S1-C subfamily serine protease
VQFKPDDTVKLDVLRDGKQLTLEVTLGTRPSNL